MKKSILISITLAVPFLTPVLVSCSNSKNENNKNEEPIKKDLSKTIEQIKLKYSNKVIEVANENEITNQLINVDIIADLNTNFEDCLFHFEKFEKNQSDSTLSILITIKDKEYQTNFETFTLKIKYKINHETLSFKNKFEFDWGDANIYTNDQKNTNDNLKDLIIKHKIDLFNNSNNFTDQYFKNNLSVENVWKNNGKGFITLKIKIDVDNDGIKEEENICITGYKIFDESQIKIPPLKDPNNPTKGEFDAEVEYWKNEIPLGLNKYYFTEEEIEKLNGNDQIYYDLIDLRTNATPINFTDACEDRPFELNVDEVEVDKDNKLINCKFSISDWYGTYTPVQFEKSFPFEIYTPDFDRLIEKIIKKSKITSIDDSYKQIKAKLFARYDVDMLNKYFELNNEELDRLFWNEPGYEKIFKNFIIDINSYDFKNPTTLNFFIQIKSDGNKDKQQKNQIIDGFKNVETIGQLDLMPIDKLKTPANAISYKGELEKFYFDEFIQTDEGNYKNNLDKVTWEDVKKEIIYHVRFYLYQMFGDNFTEINYYIKDEKNANKPNGSFVAVGEGIIDQSKNDVYFGFQSNINSTGHNAIANVKKNDRVKIELKFGYEKPLITGFMPSFIDRGTTESFTYSWYWNYQDSCNNLFDPKAPLIKDDIPRNSWSISGYSVEINGSKKINDQRLQQYGVPWFNKQYIILKKNKNN